MSTLSDVAVPAQEAVSAALLQNLNLPAMPDDQVVHFIDAVTDEVEILGDYRRAGLSELECRIRERREQNPDARAIPHPTKEIELVDEYTPYRANITTLLSAQPLLPEDEAAKVVVPVRGKVVITLPESVDIGEATAFAKAHSGHVEVTPPSHAAGNVTSILALAKKYAGTPVGDLLKSAISRDRTGDKLIYRDRKGAMKAVAS